MRSAVPRTVSVRAAVGVPNSKNPAVTTRPVRAPAKFEKDFLKPMGVPAEGIEAAVRVMESGRLFRYSAASADTSEVSNAEAEFAEMAGAKYAIAVNSCSSAIMLTLLGAGVEAGDEVLTNGFTFTALPSTIMRIGATPVLIETTENYTMDVDDLERKMESSNAKVLLLSHMRGKVCDMDRVAALCEKHGLTLLEDCAHGCGVKWRGRQLGYHGLAASYSTQSDKVINSGEGGFITTDDDAFAAKAIYWSGCYERRYGMHATPPPTELCEAAMLGQPNLSCRMSEVTAACVRPQIATLPDRVVRYNERWDIVCANIASECGDLVVVPGQHPLCDGVGDHLNFYLDAWASSEDTQVFLDTATKLGVKIGWFCSESNARWHRNWRMYGAPHYDLPNTDRVLASSFDMKMPPDFTDEDIAHIGRILGHAANVAYTSSMSTGGDTAEMSR